jgi:AcrR family transcriptional regulator
VSAANQPPKGRRPGTSTTRQAILDAARARFAQDGYASATIRKIAADAGVDASLVIQFFGTKDDLFAAAMSISPEALARITSAFDGPEDTVGERVTRAFLDVWEGEPQDSEPLLAMLRGAISHEDAAARVGLAASTLIGVIVGRRIVGVPALTNQDTESLIAVLAPAVQTILSGNI